MNIPKTTIRIQFGVSSQSTEGGKKEPDIQDRRNFLKIHLPRIGCRSYKELATKLAEGTGVSEKQMRGAVYGWVRGTSLSVSKHGIFERLANIFSVSHETIASLSRAPRKKGQKPSCSNTKKTGVREEVVGALESLLDPDLSDDSFSFSSDEYVDIVLLSTSLLGKEKIQAGELVFKLLLLIRRQRLEQQLLQNAAT